MFGSKMMLGKEDKNFVLDDDSVCDETSNDNSDFITINETNFLNTSINM